ncbi:MAG: type II toxin-antitoxin system RelE/ParE family toxin [Armatimonadota bacterium]|nr:type II toxin-antitoxin system RelE/ParE family toxin [Armatimonadota bacterium]MDW8142238.1 type II toxin-antitoxin system RelE/ParE family toxin [Armatimonadota bacterium]
MEKFELQFHGNASKVFQHLPKTVKRRIEEAIEALRLNPFFGKDICKLKGELEGLYRLRVGDYRIIYHVDEKHKVITIEAIGT